jgi:hypothetical protein
MAAVDQRRAFGDRPGGAPVRDDRDQDAEHPHAGPGY